MTTKKIESEESKPVEEEEEEKEKEKEKTKSTGELVGVIPDDDYSKLNLEGGSGGGKSKKK